MLTAERLHSLVSYEPETGLFRWRSSRRGPVREGEIAGSVRVQGYHDIGIDGRRYLAHRLAWLYVHGRWPKHEIDHINGLRSDNRLCNLREATSSENKQNLRSARADNKTSGFLGVSFRKDRSKWRAEIMVKGRSRHLGYFDSADEAHAAYLKAKAELHPFQTIAEAA